MKYKAGPPIKKCGPMCENYSGVWGWDDSGWCVHPDLETPRTVGDCDLLDNETLFPRWCPLADVPDEEV